MSNSENSPLQVQLIVYPENIKPLPFEVSFDVNGWRAYLRENWTVSIYSSIAYVITIFLLKAWMNKRPPFELRLLTLAFNLSFAIFSFLGCFRSFPEVMTLFHKSNGISQTLHRTICTWDEHTSSAAFWGFAYTVSKIPELLGTLLIIMKKRDLIFLHWYHHVAAAIYCYYIYESYDSTMRWFGLTNSFVHGVVYSYLFLKSVGYYLGFKISRHWAFKMTCLQLTEMFGGVIVCYYTLWAKNSGKGCARNYDNILITMGLYAIFAVLFAQYFYKTYFGKNKAKSE